MSNYGTPPQDPNFDPSAGGPAYGGPSYGAAAPAYAAWGKRVVATLIDAVIAFVIYLPFMIIGMIAGADSSFGGLVVVVGYLAMLGFMIWNMFVRQGSTGYTIGKEKVGIKLVGEATGAPIGAGMAFVRQLAHIIDSIICYIGYLMPLWDAKRQTIADKLLNTLVIEAPKV